MTLEANNNIEQSIQNLNLLDGLNQEEIVFLESISNKEISNLLTFQNVKDLNEKVGAFLNSDSANRLTEEGIELFSNIMTVLEKSNALQPARNEVIELRSEANQIIDRIEEQGDNFFNNPDSEKDFLRFVELSNIKLSNGKYLVDGKTYHNFLYNLKNYINNNNTSFPIRNTDKLSIMYHSGRPKAYTKSNNGEPNMYPLTFSENGLNTQSIKEIDGESNKESLDKNNKWNLKPNEKLDENNEKLPRIIINNKDTKDTYIFPIENYTHKDIKNLTPKEKENILQKMRENVKFCLLVQNSFPSLGEKDKEKIKNIVFHNLEAIKNGTYVDNLGYKYKMVEGNLYTTLRNQRNCGVWMNISKSTFEGEVDGKLISLFQEGEGINTIYHGEVNGKKYKFTAENGYIAEAEILSPQIKTLKDYCNKTDNIKLEDNKIIMETEVGKREYEIDNIKNVEIENHNPSEKMFGRFITEEIKITYNVGGTENTLEILKTEENKFIGSGGNRMDLFEFGIDYNYEKPEIKKLKKYIENIDGLSLNYDNILTIELDNGNVKKIDVSRINKFKEIKLDNGDKMIDIGISVLTDIGIKVGYNGSILMTENTKRFNGEWEGKTEEGEVSNIEVKKKTKEIFDAYKKSFDKYKVNFRYEKNQIIMREGFHISTYTILPTLQVYHSGKQKSIEQFKKELNQKLDQLKKRERVK